MAKGNNRLSTFDFNPNIGLTFAQYHSINSDPNKLKQSLLTDETRENTARKEKTAISNTFAANIRPFLNEVELPWLDAEEDRINARLKQQLALDNTQSVIRIAQEEADALVGNKALQYKKLAQAAREKEKERILTGNYNQYTKRRWDDLNKYYDDGTGTWKAGWTPVADRSIVDIWNAAVNATPTRGENKTISSTSNSHTFVDTNGNIVVDTNGNPIKNPYETKEYYVFRNGEYVPYQGELVRNNGIRSQLAGIIGSNQTHSSNTDNYTAKNQEDIINTFKDMLKDQNIIASLRQSFDNMTWLYNKAQAILNDPNATEAQRIQAQADMTVAEESLKDADGFIHKEAKDFNNWLNKQTAQYAKDSSYRLNTIGRTSSNISDYNTSLFGLGNINSNISGYMPPINNASVEGSSIEDSYGYEEQPLSAAGTSNWFNTSNWFDTNNPFNIH